MPADLIGRNGRRTAHVFRWVPFPRAAVVMAAVASCLMAGAATPVGAQGARPARADTAAAAQPPIPRVARPSLLVGTRGPLPLSARRAFLYSLAIPGLGQSRLQRGTAGALFASVELAAMVMVRRSSADLREARTYATDSLPAQFTVQGSTLGKQGVVTPRFGAELVNTRRLHVEDWIAVIAFNHLLSGADAFVSAQLWDMPVRVGVAPVPRGAAIAAVVAF